MRPGISEETFDKLNKTKLPNYFIVQSGKISSGCVTDNCIIWFSEFNSSSAYHVVFYLSQTTIEMNPFFSFIHLRKKSKSREKPTFTIHNYSINIRLFRDYKGVPSLKQNRANYEAASLVVACLLFVLALC